MKVTHSRVRIRFGLVTTALLGAVGLLALFAGGCGDRTSAAKPQPVHKLEVNPDEKVSDPAEVHPPSLLESTKLPDLANRLTTLKSRMGSGGLLVVFVDTLCPHAGAAMGEMPTVAATLAGYNIPSVLVNVQDRKDKVQTFYATHDTGTPVLYDVTTDTQKAWGIDIVPTVVLLDASWKERYRGRAVWADLARAVEKSLGLADGAVSFEAQGTSYG